MSTFQTLSFLKKRFAEAGINPRAMFGQNFLIDGNLLRLLAVTAELKTHDVVLEVGTGTGSLTLMVAPLAAHVITVEVDKQMFQLAREELAHLSNVTMLQTDALAGKNRLNPELLVAVRAQLDAAPGRGFKLVANLPYNVATPVISNLLAGNLPPARMTVTIQKELADRLAAPPGTRDYSALSVWVQSQCDVHIVRTMPPSVFWPRPKVSSAIVRLDLVPSRRESLGDRAYFHAFVRGIFLHRRKFLRSSLVHAYKGVLDKAAIDGLLAEQGLGESVRAEELSWQQLHALGEAVRKRLPAEHMPPAVDEA